jgi:hypothetical protein
MQTYIYKKFFKWANRSTGDMYRQTRHTWLQQKRRLILTLERQFLPFNRLVEGDEDPTDIFAAEID